MSWATKKLIVIDHQVYMIPYDTVFISSCWYVFVYVILDQSRTEVLMLSRPYFIIF
jgi:hypothetical protein